MSPINPRYFDLTAMRQDVKPVRRPVSDRERVEQMRADPVAHFDEVVAARKLPRGVVP
jgi:hypothetical protein